MRVFLGGTCNDSTWREELIPKLEKKNIDFFNPVVDDWDEAAQKREEKEKEECDVHLYVITPEMTGVFSIAEAVDSAHQRPTVFCVLRLEEFSKHQQKSLKAVSRLIGGKTYGFESSSLGDVVVVLKD